MILASLCNNRGANRSGLLLIEEDLSSYRYVKVPQGIQHTGFTGIGVADKLFIMASQGGALLLFDRNSMEIAGGVQPQHGKDIHSVFVHRTIVYVVATGVNGLVAFDVKGSDLVNERVIWKVSQDRFGRDFDHLNSGCIHEGRVLVSGFGLKPGPLWSSCQDGFVVDVHSGHKLKQGLCQPHSVFSSSVGLMVCESAKSKVLNLSTGNEGHVDGYVRGFCETAYGFVVATSQGRTVSKSTGLKITNPDEGGGVAGQSAVYLLDKQTLAVKSRLLTGQLEYYDLIKVGPEAKSWPLLE